MQWAYTESQLSYLYDNFFNLHYLLKWTLSYNFKKMMFYNNYEQMSKFFTIISKREFLFNFYYKLMRNNGRIN